MSRSERPSSFLSTGNPSVFAVSHHTLFLFHPLSLLFQPLPAHHTTHHQTYRYRTTFMLITKFMLHHRSGMWVSSLLGVCTKPADSRTVHLVQPSRPASVTVNAAIAAWFLRHLQANESYNTLGKLYGTVLNLLLRGRQKTSWCLVLCGKGGNNTMAKDRRVSRKSSARRRHGGCSDCTV